MRCIVHIQLSVETTACCSLRVVPPFRGVVPSDDDVVVELLCARLFKLDPITGIKSRLLLQLPLSHLLSKLNPSSIEKFTTSSYLFILPTSKSNSFSHPLFSCFVPRPLWSLPWLMPTSRQRLQLHLTCRVRSIGRYESPRSTRVS